MVVVVEVVMVVVMVSVCLSTYYYKLLVMLTYKQPQLKQLKKTKLKVDNSTYTHLHRLQQSVC